MSQAQQVDYVYDAMINGGQAAKVLAVEAVLAFLDGDGDAAFSLSGRVLELSGVDIVDYID